MITLETPLPCLGRTVAAHEEEARWGVIERFVDNGRLIRVRVFTGRGVAIKAWGPERLSLAQTWAAELWRPARIEEIPPRMVELVREIALEEPAR